VFTAVIQPPLQLFVVVPSAYYLMHNADIHGVKDILINCGYPLIERFPLMFFTSAAVLLVGIARWYFGASARKSAPAPEGTRPTRGGLSAKLSSLLGGGSDADPADPEPRRRHTVDRHASGARKPAADRGARGARPVKRADAPSRSRHARPPDTEIIEPVVDIDRPRRRRPRPTEQPPEPRRRSRTSAEREPRGSVPPRSDRRDPRERDRDRDRDGERAQRPQRPQRRSRYDDYEPLEPHSPTGNVSHHPISRVRYRGADESERTEYRTRRRAPRDADADRWELDI
jgi:hypothetical protein